MKTRGGRIVEPEKSQTFSLLLNQVRSFRIFSGYSKKSGESGKMSGLSGL
jgi:hypothetical protein